MKQAERMKALEAAKSWGAVAWESWKVGDAEKAEAAERAKEWCLSSVETEEKGV